MKVVASITAFEFYKKVGFRKTRKGKHRMKDQVINIYHMRKDLE